MSIMTQLEFALGFSGSEKEIGQYILNNGDTVLGMTVKDLANVTYTSPATIVRLCKKIGLEGYNDFKIKYSAELQYHLTTKERIDVNFPFEKEDSQIEIAHNLATMSAEVIKDTLHLLDIDLLEKTVDELMKYQDIDVYGNGNSLIAALSFQHKMMRINRDVNIHSMSGEQLFFAYNSSPKRIAILISYSGETAEMIKIAEVLKEKKTPMVILTSVGDNHLSHYATYLLHMGSREKIFRKIAPFASTISMEYLLNVIFSCIFQRDYKKNLETKISYDTKNDVRHPLQSPIND